MGDDVTILVPWLETVLIAPVKPGGLLGIDLDDYVYDAPAGELTEFAGHRYRSPLGEPDVPIIVGD